MKTTQKMGATEWLLLLLLSVLWGGSFFFFKVLVDAQLPPFTIVLGRVGIAAIALLSIVYSSGRRMPKSPAVWGAFLVMGALNNVLPFSLIVFGETQISSGLASIFNATTPIFTVLLAQVLTSDERLTSGKIAGIVLGLLGVVVLIGPAAVHGLNVASIAQLACLGAAFIYGCAGIYGRRFKAMGVAPIVTAAGQVCGSTIIMIPLAAIVDRPWSLAHAPSSTAWWAMIALALLSTAVAYIIYFRILSVAGATNLLLVTFLIPVSALVLGTFVLGERLGVTAFAGMAIIFLGLAAIDGRLIRVLLKPPGRDPMIGVHSGSETVEAMLRIKEGGSTTVGRSVDSYEI